MTKLEALKELKARIETGELNANNRHWLTALDARCWDHAWQAYRGSLDAAKALHEAVLPERPVKITDLSQGDEGDTRWSVSVNWHHIEWQPTFTAFGPFAHSATDGCPARAWLIAIISALIAQEEQK